MATNPANRPVNPFDITKATDFDDAQIAATWVDLPSQGGFRSLIDPTSPVTRFVLGGKGSGRTHLLRYYSSHLQALRLKEKGIAALSQDGYVGVYVNSGTLNPGRFSGKGQNDDTWHAVFAYYFDVALALRLLMAVDEVWKACGEEIAISATIRDKVCGLFDVPVKRTASLIDDLYRILRGLDSSINTAALTRELNVAIASTPGRLVFGTVRVLCGLGGPLQSLHFALLLDEFENFSELQQRYIHTLIREKNNSVSFLVGTRTFGMRTTQTAAGERNREGSEFETIELDSFFRSRRGDYENFCRSLVARRLAHSGYFVPPDDRDLLSTLRGYFFEPPNTGATGAASDFALSDTPGPRKCLIRLRDQLRTHRPLSISDDGIDRIVQCLQFPDDPVVEKIAVYLLYRAWHNRRNLLDAANGIASDAQSFRAGNRTGTFATTVGHFRGDMLAQLLHEYKQKQRYLGFSESVALSAGLPRGLLVVLKHVFRWSIFNGEHPFTVGQAISEDSQRSGVAEAGRWFLTDLPGIGPNGVEAREAIERLGRFLQALRFADKPTESSACTVGLQRGVLSARAVATVDHCIQSSFLLPIAAGHRDRNTGVRRQKLQLHPMLCPRWHLPTGRRGVVELSPEEATAIFDSTTASRLRVAVGARLARMNAPFQPESHSNRPGLEFNG